MAEHLLVFPDRDDAERVADDLRDEGFADVRVVREALAGEDDAEGHDWAVHVAEEVLGDEEDGLDVDDGLGERLAALAEEFDGWYDPDPA